MRTLLVSMILFLSFALSGCLGGACGGADYGVGNHDSAGSYSGAYANIAAVGSSGAAKDLDLTFSVDAQGQVGGAAREPSSGRTATITGRVGDYFSACTDDTTTLTLDLAFSDGANRQIEAMRSRSELADFARVSATYTQDGQPIGRGRIALTKTAS